MYLQYYGLTEKPFSQTPDPRFLYWNDGNREALASLLYGIQERKGFVTMIGEAGTGKTTLLRKLLDDLGQEVVSVFLFNPNATFEEILEYTLSELGISAPSGRKLAMLQRLNEFLLAAFAEGRNTILLIDEAQDLAPDVLESLRLLSNLETSQEKILQIVLSGQPELATRLADPNLRQLKQRIAVRCHLEPLTRPELGAYIEQRLRIGGRESTLFTEDSLDEIWRFAQGIPRLVNTVCDNALLVGYALGRDSLDQEVVREVVADLQRLDVPTTAIPAEQATPTPPLPAPAAQTSPQPTPADPVTAAPPPAAPVETPAPVSPSETAAPDPAPEIVTEDPEPIAISADEHPHPSPSEGALQGTPPGPAVRAESAQPAPSMRPTFIGTGVSANPGRATTTAAIGAIAGGVILFAAILQFGPSREEAPNPELFEGIPIPETGAGPDQTAQLRNSERNLADLQESDVRSRLPETESGPLGDPFARMDGRPLDERRDQPPTDRRAGPRDGRLADTPAERWAEADRDHPSEGLPRERFPEAAGRPSGDDRLRPRQEPVAGREPSGNAETGISTRVFAALPDRALGNPTDGEADRPLTEKPENPAVPPAYKDVEVRRGDTLLSLAEREYGATNLTTIDMLHQANPRLRDVDFIREGSVLRFPDPGPAARVVRDQKGLSVIAMTTPAFSTALTLQRALEERHGATVELELVELSQGTELYRVAFRGFATRSEALGLARKLGSILEDPRS